MIPSLLHTPSLLHMHPFITSHSLLHMIPSLLHMHPFITSHPFLHYFTCIPTIPSLLHIHYFTCTPSLFHFITSHAPLHYFVRPYYFNPFISLHMHPFITSHLFITSHDPFHYFNPFITYYQWHPFITSEGKLLHSGLLHTPSLLHTYLLISSIPTLWSTIPTESLHRNITSQIVSARLHQNDHRENIRDNIQCTTCNLVAGFSWVTHRTYEMLQYPEGKHFVSLYTGPPCGFFLHPPSPPDPNVPSGWTLCYISGETDAQLFQYPCKTLLQGLPNPYNTADGLLAAGGNFGCWNLLQYPNSDMYGACFDDYQHDIKVEDCARCTAMAVCIRYPQ